MTSPQIVMRIVTSPKTSAIVISEETSSSQSVPEIYPWLPGRQREEKGSRKAREIALWANPRTPSPLWQRVIMLTSFGEKIFHSRHGG